MLMQLIDFLRFAVIRDRAHPFCYTYWSLIGKQLLECS